MKLLTVRLTIILRIAHLVILSSSERSDDIDADRLKNYSRSLAPYSCESSDCDGDGASSSAVSDDDAEDGRLSDLFW